MKRILTSLFMLVACVSLSAQMLPYQKRQPKMIIHEPLSISDLENVSSRMQAMRVSPLSSEGTKASSPTKVNSIVILVEFPDKSFIVSDIETKIYNMLNQSGYSFNGANGSVKEYFDAQFLGEVAFSFDVVRAPVLSNNRTYYGKNKNDDDIDVNVPQMIAEACRAVDDKVDFSKYAVGGEVPMVFVFFAGEDETVNYGTSKYNSDLIWPHSSEITPITLDGVKISQYACTSEVEPVYTSQTRYTLELATIGTFCHEYSHTLGLMDYYDTDYELSGGYSAACWLSLALMDAGNYNDNGNTPPPYNAVDYFTVNMLRENNVAKVKGMNFIPLEAGRNYILAPFSLENKNLYYVSNGSDDEFYLFDVHSTSSKWDAHIGGTGLLIYHVDFSRNSAGYSETYGRSMTAYNRWQYNEINCRPTYQCVDLVEADGRSDKKQVYQGDADSGLFFPYRNKTSFSPETTPAMYFRTGTQPKVAIQNITTQSNGNVAFSVVAYEDPNNPGGGDNPDPPAPVVVPAVSSDGISATVFQNLAILSFKADMDTDLAPQITYNAVAPGAEKISVEAVKAADGTYYFRLDNLKPRTTYSVEAHFVKDGLEGAKKTVSFLTKTRSTYGPYIDFSSNADGRNEDGTFKKGARLALAVNNCLNSAMEQRNVSVKNVEYYFEGQPVKFTDGYFVMPSSGDLKIKIFYSDGSETVLCKFIRMK